MTELGSRLRAAREEKGISLEQLQSMTKIQKKYLIGIEEGNYDLMPGKFYARAFIKQYAEAVGLSPEELFEEYRSEIPAAYEEDLTEQLSRVQSRRAMPAGTNKLFEFLPKIIATVVVIAALFFIWNFITKSINTADQHEGNKEEQAVDIKESDEIKPPDESKSKNDSEKSGEKDKDDRPNNEAADSSGTQSITAEGVSGIVTTYKLSKAKKFELKVSAAATGETWISVSDGSNQTLFQGTLKNGESQSFDLTDQNEAYIIAGRTVDTDIYVNGEKLEYEISPDQYVRQDIRIQFEKEE
ncbi:helix-turn-helix domain-containing protein [Siminovitchia sp. 179-K 8D1 HS]|uniref:helix-turn-helix domain-containing protein n=1 Tax=Siminovitchia sp. 179-K 8D1 HS TaxID=3142385 RepID=UPI0039A3A1C9